MSSSLKCCLPQSSSNSADLPWAHLITALSLWWTVESGRRAAYRHVLRTSAAPAAASGAASITLTARRPFKTDRLLYERNWKYIFHKTWVVVTFSCRIFTSDSAVLKPFGRFLAFLCPWRCEASASCRRRGSDRVPVQIRRGVTSSPSGAAAVIHSPSHSPTCSLGSALQHVVIPTVPPENRWANRSIPRVRISLNTETKGLL